MMLCIVYDNDDKQDMELNDATMRPTGETNGKNRTIIISHVYMHKIR